MLAFDEALNPLDRASVEMHQDLEFVNTFMLLSSPHPHLMKRIHTESLLFFTLAFIAIPVFAADQAGGDEPVVVSPGNNNSPPSDAIVLFDGTTLLSWQNGDGEPPKWTLEDGAMVVGKGGIRTREEFGDIQLHIEWATPLEVKGDGQGRGNSGVYFQGRYEIQVLDSYENKTYANGQAGAFYLHSAPLVNASRKPGEWQTYDVVFHSPKVDQAGQITPGSFTVLHNGVLIQDNVPIPGEPTTAAARKGVSPKGPIFLQDHGNPVRYRNIWLREL